MKKLILFAAVFAIALFANFASALTSIEAPAVDAEGKGILSLVSVSTIAGTGDIFMSITPLTGIDTQHSEKTAVVIAAQKAGVDPEKYNVMFKIDSTAEVVDGPSAGAVLTLATYAEFSGKKMRRDIALTGTIDREGNVGKVGGVFEKAAAVAESKVKNYKIFLVPRGQRIQSGVDLAKYAKEKWDLQVAEVDTIDDVLNYAFNTSEGSEIKVVEKIIPPLKLVEFKTTKEAAQFKEIALNEIAQTKMRLKEAKLSRELIVQVEELIKQAEISLSKGYYYSGANTAFLATITLDEITNANATRREMRDKIKSLKSQIAALNFSNQTEGNLDFVIGAKLRYYWAFQKVKSAEDAIAIGNTAQAAGDLSLADSWLRAATNMNSLAKKNEIGFALPDIYFRDYAAKMIDDAKELGDDGLLDSEGADHLNTAVMIFENADYLAAAFDASFAISYSDAYDFVEESGYAQVVQKLCNANSFEVTCDVFKEKGYKSLWAQLYYAHSLYNYQESNRTRDMATLLNGVKLWKLSEGFEKIEKEAIELAKNPPAISTEITPTATKKGELEVRAEIAAVPENSYRDLIVYSILGLVILLVIYSFAVKRKTNDVGEMPMDKDMLLEKAEQMLLQGKISEKSFEYFKGKYAEVKKPPIGKEKKQGKK